jgi:hypothetical protein
MVANDRREDDNASRSHPLSDERQVSRMMQARALNGRCDNTLLDLALTPQL